MKLPSRFLSETNISKLPHHYLFASTPVCLSIAYSVPTVNFYFKAFFLDNYSSSLCMLMCHFPQVYNPSFINRETGASEKYVQPSGKKK